MEWLLRGLMYEVLSGDCLEVMPTLDAESFDSIVSDPPYGLEFMGKEWDRGVPGVPFWQEALRVAKPGAHLLAFGGTRTYHRLVSAIEDAGWEIRDMICWHYGSGFPKSMDVSKAIDKMAGAEREVVGSYERAGRSGGILGKETVITRNLTNPSSDDAKHWSGWGTALKPATEPICLARKPFRGTVASNVLKHGTGALNIDGCRISAEDALEGRERHGGGKSFADGSSGFRQDAITTSPAGRWPANLIHDGSEEVVALFPETESGKPCGVKSGHNNEIYGEYGGGIPVTGFGDAGSAARFFYVAKADSNERPEAGGVQHPTVKPVDLMRYLCRLVTRPGGLILDPFAGSGTTLQAALEEGFSCVGIELNPDYVRLINERLRNTTPSLFSEVS